MNDAPHDHDRPGIPEQRTALAAARALLTTADLGAAHQAAEAAMTPVGKDPGRPCPVCAIVAATSLGIAVAEQVAAELVARLAPVIRAAMLDAIASAERELRSAGN